MPLSPRLSNMLAGKQTVVLKAERKLQADGFIRFKDGRIAVINRPGLEEASCESYRVVKTGYDRLLLEAEAK